MNKSRKLVMYNNERSEERKIKENTGNLENIEIKSHITPLYTHHSGITLVALVVTIVVMLILAGVSITALLGDDGIISKANDAANLMNEIMQNEKQEMNNLLDEILESKDETGTLIIFFKDTSDGEYVSGGKVSIFSDSNLTTQIQNISLSNSGATVELPVGVYYVQMSEAPAGYDLNIEIKKVSIQADNENICEISITTGTELPDIDLQGKINITTIENASTFYDRYRESDVTLQFLKDSSSQEPVPAELSVTLYKIGERNTDGTYSYTEKFLNSGLEELTLYSIYGGQTDFFYSISDYIDSKNSEEMTIFPIMSGASDYEGNIVYNNLETGVYLVKTEEMTSGRITYKEFNALFEAPYIAVDNVNYYSFSAQCFPESVYQSPIY